MIPEKPSLEKKIALALENWKRLLNKLEIKFFSPYKIEDISVSIYLPDFGSKRGMFINFTESPNFDIDKSMVDYANNNGYFYSFLNVDLYKEYNEEIFIGSIEDWTLDN